MSDSEHSRLSSAEASQETERAIAHLPDHPLGVKHPLLGCQPLGIPLLQPKFIRPLGANALVVNASSRRSPQRHLMQNWGEWHLGDSQMLGSSESLGLSASRFNAPMQSAAEDSGFDSHSVVVGTSVSDVSSDISDIGLESQPHAPQHQLYDSSDGDISSHGSSDPSSNRLNDRSNHLGNLDGRSLEALQARVLQAKDSNELSSGQPQLTPVGDRMPPAHFAESAPRARFNSSKPVDVESLPVVDPEPRDTHADSPSHEFLPAGQTLIQPKADESASTDEPSPDLPDVQLDSALSQIQLNQGPELNVQHPSQSPLTQLSVQEAIAQPRPLDTDEPSVPPDVSKPSMLGHAGTVQAVQSDSHLQSPPSSAPEIIHQPVLDESQSPVIKDVAPVSETPIHSLPVIQSSTALSKSPHLSSTPISNEEDMHRSSEPPPLNDQLQVPVQRRVIGADASDTHSSTPLNQKPLQSVNLATAKAMLAQQDQAKASQHSQVHLSRQPRSTIADVADLGDKRGYAANNNVLQRFPGSNHQATAASSHVDVNTPNQAVSANTAESTLPNMGHLTSDQQPTHDPEHDTLQPSRSTAASQIIEHLDEQASTPVLESPTESSSNPRLASEPAIAQPKLHSHFDQSQPSQSPQLSQSSRQSSSSPSSNQPPSHPNTQAHPPKSPNLSTTPHPSAIQRTVSWLKQQVVGRSPKQSSVDSNPAPQSLSPTHESDRQHHVESPLIQEKAVQAADKRTHPSQEGTPQDFVSEANPVNSRLGANDIQSSSGSSRPPLSPQQSVLQRSVDSISNPISLAASLHNENEADSSEPAQRRIDDSSPFSTVQNQDDSYLTDSYLADTIAEHLESTPQSESVSASSAPTPVSSASESPNLVDSLSSRDSGDTSHSGDTTYDGDRPTAPQSIEPLRQQISGVTNHSAIRQLASEPVDIDAGSQPAPDNELHGEHSGTQDNKQLSGEVQTPRSPIEGDRF
ncbi:MAG: hypothetical protein AAFQ57_07710, partial [Cyanobacteria bacterium J06626_14]